MKCKFMFQRSNNNINTRSIIDICVDEDAMSCLVFPGGDWKSVITGHLICDLVMTLYVI